MLQQTTYTKVEIFKIQVLSTLMFPLSLFFPVNTDVSGKTIHKGDT